MQHQIRLSTPDRFDHGDVRHRICRVCGCYDACLSKRCPGYPVAPSMQRVYHWINDVIKLHLSYERGTTSHDNVCLNDIRERIKWQTRNI